MYLGSKREAARAARARRAKAHPILSPVVKATPSADGKTWTLVLECPSTIDRGAVVKHDVLIERARGVAKPPVEMLCPRCTGTVTRAEVLDAMAKG